VFVNQQKLILTNSDFIATAMEERDVSRVEMNEFFKILISEEI